MESQTPVPSPIPTSSENAFQKYYIGVLKKYATFDGRASRKEYWMFVLFNVIAGVVIGLVSGFLGFGSEGEANMISGIYNLAILVPSLAVAVRRMHDTDHSGWWILVPIVNLIFTLTSSQKTTNRFGPMPII